MPNDDPLNRIARAAVSPGGPLDSLAWVTLLGPYPTLTAMNRAHCGVARGRSVLELHARDDLLDGLQRVAETAYAEDRSADLIPIYVQLLSDTEELLGADHIWSIEARGWLAQGYVGLELWADAIPLLELRVCDADMPSTKFQLGLAYSREGHFAEAKAVWEPVLEQLEATVGTDHPNSRMLRDELSRL